MKLNLKNIIDTLQDVRNYVFPIKKITNKFRNISSKKDLKNFIQERSAHVTQTTLYGYIKTRIGSRYAMMFEDDVFLKSIIGNLFPTTIISFARSNEPPIFPPG